MCGRKIDVRMSTATINQLCEYYNTTSISFAVRSCVQDCLLQQALFTKNKRSITPAQTLKTVKKQKKLCTKDKRISVRLSEQAVDFLKIYYGAKTNTDTLHCCIHDVLNKVAYELPLKGTDKVVYMIGQKNVGMQKFLNESFDDIRNIYRIDGYAEPFCGTANVLLHTAEMDAEFLNDNSTDLVNVLRVIQRYPSEFKLSLLSVSLNKNTFDKFKKDLKNTFLLKSNKSKQIERATAFYFVRYISVYGKGEYIKSKTSIDGYHRRLDSIAPLSKRLQGVDIKKRDALYFGKILNEEAENLLIYFDAPYIDTEEHYKINNQKKEVFSSHLALRNRVEKLRRKNICLLSYRITVPTCKRKKKNSDNKLRGRLDELYLNQGFWYRLKKFDSKKGQVEILISTVPFCGAKPYTTPMREVEVM